MISIDNFRSGVLHELLLIVEEKINVNFDSSLSIKELSTISGYSFRHLQRIFFIYTGVKLGAYVRRRRLTRAALLLKFSNMGIVDIAIISGFGTVQAFSRAFSRQFKSPPGLFKNSEGWDFSHHYERYHQDSYLLNYEIVNFRDGLLGGEFDFMAFNRLSFTIETGCGEMICKTRVIDCGEKLRQGRYVFIKFSSDCKTDSELILYIYDYLLPCLSLTVDGVHILKSKSRIYAIPLAL